MINRILKNLAIDKLNAMQLESIDIHNSNKKVMIVAPTGSGKSLAYLLPTINKIEKNESDALKALVIAPTRELALQIESLFRSFKSGHKVSVLYGGHSFKSEVSVLREMPKVIIATPGRICDHLRRGTLNIEHVGHIILDEFDKTLELGFLEEIGELFDAIKFDSITLVSATQSVKVPSFLNMDKPVLVSYNKEEIIPQSHTDSYIVRADSTKRVMKLLDLLASKDKESSIVFCNYREYSEKISEFLNRKGIDNVCFHGALKQEYRESSLIKFKNGSVNVLVSTSLAARGIDISHVKNIIHLQFPDKEDEFTHRNGRTARMNSDGAIYLVTEEDEVLPDYINVDEYNEVSFPFADEDIAKPEYATLYIGLGRKDKLRKIDIVGFLIQQGGILKEDIGEIVLKDKISFVAIRRIYAYNLAEKIKGEKIKGTRCKFLII